MNKKQVGHNDILWDRVARQALLKNRDDLAREALKRKRKYQQDAISLEAKLTKLATMTETLIRNSPDLRPK